jgi:hypothetical protein
MIRDDFLGEVLTFGEGMSGNHRIPCQVHSGTHILSFDNITISLEESKVIADVIRINLIEISDKWPSSGSFRLFHHISINSDADWGRGLRKLLGGANSTFIGLEGNP